MPLDITALIVSFYFDGIPKLYHTDPMDTYPAYKASAASWGATAVYRCLRTISVMSSRHTTDYQTSDQDPPGRSLVTKLTIMRQH